MKTRLALAFVAATSITGCAGTPTGPSVMVLAGNGKTIEQFQADDNACRQWASRELERTKGGQVPAQGRYDIAYMQCMYAKGNQIPSAARSPAPTTSSTPAPPGTPTAAPLAWPPTRAQIDCEQSGGVWRAALNFCEFPSPDRRWR
jgi:hypothetical protein